MNVVSLGMPPMTFHDSWQGLDLSQATYTFAATLGRLVNPDTCESADLSPTSSLPLATGTQTCYILLNRKLVEIALQLIICGHAVKHARS